MCYREDTGADYLDYRLATSRDCLFTEGGGRARSIDRVSLPDKPLENTTPPERRELAQLPARLAQLPGFGASMATKVLHKKRPALIPLLDNQAIFGAYMNPFWPQRLAAADTIKDENKICMALDWIAYDLVRAENGAAWDILLALEPDRTRIQLFDSI